MSLRKSVPFATLHVQEAQRVCLYHVCHLKPRWEVTDLTQRCLAKDHELLLCSKSLSALPGIITCGLLLPKNFAIWNILMEYSHGLVLWQPPDGSTRSIKWKPQTPVGLPYVVFRIVVKFPLDVYLSRFPGPTGPEGTTHTRTVQTSKARPDLGFPACVSFLLMGALYSKYLGEDRPLVFT